MKYYCHVPIDVAVVYEAPEEREAEKQKGRRFRKLKAIISKRGFPFSDTVLMERFLAVDDQCEGMQELIATVLNEIPTSLDRNRDHEGYSFPTGRRFDSRPNRLDRRQSQSLTPYYSDYHLEDRRDLSHRTLQKLGMISTLL